MRKINVRSPFYISGEEDYQPIVVPIAYYYYSVTECGGSTVLNVRTQIQLTNGQAVNVQGYGSTCFEVTGTLSASNELDIITSYTNCDACNGIPDYNYYAAELCAGGGATNLRSSNTYSTGNVVSFGSDCYTITGLGSTNTNDILDSFNNCEHCETGLDYKYYIGTECDGTQTVVFKALDTDLSSQVYKLSGYGDRCFTRGQETTTASDVYITDSFGDCATCKPIDPYTYYTATQCGGGASITFRSQTAFVNGQAVTLSGSSTCYEVTGTTTTATATTYGVRYEDCAACAAGNDPYKYYEALKCDGTGSVIKVKFSKSIDFTFLSARIWKVQGQGENCFNILSETTNTGTVYIGLGECSQCPSADPYKYYLTTNCDTGTQIPIRADKSIAMLGKAVKIAGDPNNCYNVIQEVTTTNTNDWANQYTNCATCLATLVPDITLYDLNILTQYTGTSLVGKTPSQLRDEFNCLACVEGAYVKVTYRAEQVPLGIGGQIYDANGNKNTSLNGHFVSNSISIFEPNSSICHNGQIEFPLIYSISNGVVTAVNTRTPSTCYSLPTTSELVYLDCGETHSQGQDAGRKTYRLYNSGTGNATVTITGDKVPVKFTLNWNGNSVTTGYIGDSIYNAQLLANGVPGGDINTTSGGNKNTTLTINKTLAYPNIVELEVFSPLLNDNYTVSFSDCPALSTPTFASDSYVRITGNVYQFTDDYGNMQNAIRYNAINSNPGSLYDCMMPFFNNNSYSQFSESLLASGRGNWIRLIQPQGNYYSQSILNVFLDTSGNYADKLESPTLEKDLKYFRDNLSNFNLENVYIIIYVVDPKTESDFILRYNWLLSLLNSLNTKNAPYGWKDIYDQDRIRIVYNVERVSDIEYYRDIMAEQINALGVGINLTC